MPNIISPCLYLRYFNKKMYHFYLLIMVPSVFTEKVFKDLRNVENGHTENKIANILMTMGNISQHPDRIETIADKSPEVMRNDEAHNILSKLSDDKLLKLLSEQTNKNANFASDLLSIDDIQNKKRMMVQKEQHDDNLINNAKKNDALFRLENEVLKPHLQNNEEYKAWQKLSNLLSDLPNQLKNNKEQSLEEEEKEILFDIIIGELKSLCFKKYSKPVKNTLPKQYMKRNQHNNEEFLFLILSEDINENSNELVSWNTKILEKNCSVVVLGPITKHLPTNQLNNIMNRIATELSKPEYLSLLQQLSKGFAKDKAVRDMLVLGAQSRRYMKPHRCNHRSQLARVYGGPKWLLCTGYLNINTPSLYD